MSAGHLGGFTGKPIASTALGTQPVASQPKPAPVPVEQTLVDRAAGSAQTPLEIDAMKAPTHAQSDVSERRSTFIANQQLGTKNADLPALLAHEESVIAREDYVLEEEFRLKSVQAEVAAAQVALNSSVARHAD